MPDGSAQGAQAMFVLAAKRERCTERQVNLTTSLAFLAPQEGPRTGTPPFVAGFFFVGTTQVDERAGRGAIIHSGSRAEVRSMRAWHYACDCKAPESARQRDNAAANSEDVNG